VTPQPLRHPGVLNDGFKHVTGSQRFEQHCMPGNMMMVHLKQQQQVSLRIPNTAIDIFAV
jgi:hypothetical protein